MSLSLTLEQLLDELEDPHALAVLPNTRAAARVRAAFAHRQQHQGARTWSAPEVLSWEQWTSSLWTRMVLDGVDERMLLNSAQEISLWREIIAADESQQHRLASPDSLAELARSAWKLAADHLATDRIARSASTHDARVFAGWARSFAARCAREQYLSAAVLDAALALHANAARLQEHRRLIVCNLAEITPAQTAFLEALRSSGTQINHAVLVSARHTGAVRGTTEFDDPRTELQSALHWLRQRIAVKPDGCFGLILPDVRRERTELEPALREILAPELSDICLEHAPPWAGIERKVLASTPAISALLDLARWLRGPLPLDRLSRLLLSPALTPPEEMTANARFDAHKLQQMVLLRPEITLRVVCELAERHASLNLAACLRSLCDLEQRISAATQKRSYAEWTEVYRELIHLTGWPSPGVERTPSPQERAVAEAFDAVLDLVTTLDFSGRRVTFHEAAAAIERQMAVSAPPETATDAPLLIMEPAEAAGLVFDGAVFLRATDANLPGPSRPHPLLDWGLQRDLHMPGASPDIHREQLRKKTGDLLDASGEVLFTSAKHDADGALQPSSLPASLGLAPVHVDAYAPTCTSPVKLIRCSDDEPLPPPLEIDIRGGSRLLKLQAACGFLAFAELRLNGREIDAQDAGFDALETGNVLHDALEIFWSDVRSHAELSAMSESRRAEAVRAAIRSAVAKFDLHGPWDRAYIGLMKARMQRVLMSWLEHELERGPFTVLDSERKEVIGIGPLRLHVRVDRIDMVPTAEGGNGTVFVDYKTGRNARIAAWDGIRPDEPQLPLYAMLCEPEELAGLAFARVRAGKEMAWAGISQHQGIFPKGSRVEDLAMRTEQWRDVLNQLAQDFYDGKNDIAPKSFATSCTHCAQRLLCRVDADALMRGTDDTDEGDDA